MPAKCRTVPLGKMIMVTLGGVKVSMSIKPISEKLWYVYG